MNCLHIGDMAIPLDGLRPGSVADMSRRVNESARQGQALLDRALAENGDLLVTSVAAERARVLSEAVSTRDELRDLGRCVFRCAVAATLFSAPVIAFFKTDPTIFQALPTWGKVGVLGIAITSIFLCFSAVAGTIIIGGAYVYGYLFASASDGAARLVSIANSRLVAGRERLYHLRPTDEGRTRLRQIHYDAVGECYRSDGKLHVCDLAGSEIIRLEGVSPQEADTFVAHVVDRSARARANFRTA